MRSPALWQRMRSGARTFAELAAITGFVCAVILWAGVA